MQTGAKNRQSGLVADLNARSVVGITLLAIVICFYATMAWTVYISFTRSRMLPNYQFVGLEQYARLFSTDRWNTALVNAFLFGGLMILGSLVIGVLLAVLLDRRVRCESAFRTIFLYPMSMSFIVTGLAWQWILTPGIGLQSFMRQLGWTSFQFDWLGNAQLAIYAVVCAAVWHQAGLIMVIMLAGLRNIDGEIWRAAKLDGIPVYRTYLSIVLPMLSPLLGVCIILLIEVVVKSYDLVVALTGGGPGFASDLPARFVIDSTFERGNLGLASAGAVVMLIAVAASLAPYIFLQNRGQAGR